MTPHHFQITSADNLSLAACEWGNRQGQPIVFIHGFSQCHLAWVKQMADPALAAFRCLAFDLRGHGASDKPLDKARYSDDRLWADDLAAAIAAAGGRQAVLVAWSYAGRTVADYVRHYGIDRIGGVNFVAAATKSGKAFMGPAMGATGGMLSEVLAENITATRAFVRACFEKLPSPDELETIVAYNMVVPPRVRAAMFERTANPGDTLALLKVPTLVTHGEKDAIVLEAAGRATAAAVPGARLSCYDDVGHTPFMEDATRFNRELAALARQVAG